MKKSVNNNAKKMLVIIVLAVTAVFNTAFGQVPAPDFDIYPVKVSPDQHLQFRLPNDIRSGDMITGTVIESNVNNLPETKKNAATLEGMVIEIDGKQTKLSNRIFSFIVPAGLTSIPFLIKNSSGQIIERGQIPVFPQTANNMQAAANGMNFNPGVICQPGEPLTISGNFDGNAANTNVSINNILCEKIAESPREIFVLSSANLPAGQAIIKIEEGGVSKSMPIQVVTVNLSTNKPVIQRNGKATISVNIDGAENLDLEKNHFRVVLTNHSPGIVSFRAANSNTLNWDLNNSNTKNGSARLTTQLIGSAAGSYTISASLKAVKANTPPLLNEHPDPKPIGGAGTNIADDVPIDMSGVTAAELTVKRISKRLEATYCDLLWRIENDKISNGGSGKDSAVLNGWLSMIIIELGRRNMELPKCK